MTRLLLLALLLSGCTVTKVPVALDGSRADGTVEMGYEYGSLETPQVDWEQTRQNAAARCQRWGYSNAEAFGGSKRQCVIGDAFGCSRYLESVEYQCVE